MHWAGHPLDDILRPVSEVLQDRARSQSREVRGQRADVGRDGHPIVVEDHRKVGLEFAPVIERFPTHPAANRGIARDSHYFVLGAQAIPGRGEPQPRRDSPSPHDPPQRYRAHVPRGARTR
ncbi:MAG: hypothetical protein UZ18_ATM001000693 [Armatimonadetes bacterium OLB18]|nr:MAG: hypothetical protein UZ18_ATM001000693 [Armatimonadetes bacterium OLB18]